MNNKIIIGLVVLLLVGGVGFLLISKKGDSGEKSGGVFTSLKDALSKSISLECNFLPFILLKLRLAADFIILRIKG